MVAIGGIADIDRHGGSMHRKRTTQSGHHHTIPPLSVCLPSAVGYPHEASGVTNEAARVHHPYRHYRGGMAHSNARATEERSIRYRPTDRLSCTLAQP